MSRAKDEHNAVEVLLAGAAKTIRNVRYCWLVTEAEDGGSNPRPMGRLLHDADEDEWTIRFITDGRSRKVADMRRTSRVAIIFQHAPDDAFVTLIGKARLCESASEAGKRWTDALDTFFPGEEDRANARTNAIVVAVDIERIELWIRGVTPEPFGLRATILERDAGRGWRVIPADGKAARPKFLDRRQNPRP
jgi:general stress protein 26